MAHTNSKIYYDQREKLSGPKGKKEKPELRNSHGIHKQPDRQTEREREREREREICPPLLNCKSKEENGPMAQACFFTHRTGKQNQLFLL